MTVILLRFRILITDDGLDNTISGFMLVRNRNPTAEAPRTQRKNFLFVGSKIPATGRDADKQKDLHSFRTRLSGDSDLGRGE
jgi:hypothetical protein